MPDRKALPKKHYTSGTIITGKAKTKIEKFLIAKREYG